MFWASDFKKPRYRLGFKLHAECDWSWGKHCSIYRENNSQQIVYGIKRIYNITKAKRALWLVNLTSTICPWVYAADVCADVYKANLLTDIVSKVMADVLLPEMRNCLHSCLKLKLYRVTGVQSVVMNEFSRACFLLSCKTTRTFFCDVAQ